MRACPFCGFDEGWTEESNYEKPIKYQVVCNVCKSTGPISNTKEMAEKKWDGLLSKIEDQKKFKEVLNESRAPKILEKNPKLLYDLILDVFNNNISGNVYEEDDKAFREIIKSLINKRTLHKYELYDIVGPIMWEGDGGNLNEQEVEIFVEYLYKALTGESTMFEDMSGAGSVPGVGTSQPASTAAMTGAQQTSDSAKGSGDKFSDGDLYDQKGKLKKKKKVNESYIKLDGIRYSVERIEDDRIFIVPLYNPYGGNRHSSPLSTPGFWINIKDKRIEKLEENNMSPYDPIAGMMAKKLGVKQPFKKKDSKTNTVEQNTIDETKNPSIPFKLETLDDYAKASKHVPSHPLQKKTKKINEESEHHEESLKDVHAKNKLVELGIPYIYRQGPSGNKRVYIKGNVNDVVDKLLKLGWEEIKDNNKNIKIFNKDGKELTIFTDGKDMPRVTLTPISNNADSTSTLESLNTIKLVSNSLEPYI